MQNDQDSAQFQPKKISVIWTSEVFRNFCLAPVSSGNCSPLIITLNLKVDRNTQPFGRLDICTIYSQHSSGKSRAEMRDHSPNDEKSVMVVDDDPDVRESMSQLLEAKGYVVLQADNGQTAWSY